MVERTLSTLVLGVFACGRIGFDPLDDATGTPTDAAAVCLVPGHDEDGDGITDVCDGCPHIADVQQLDTDGDGVNDVCDPYPGVRSERIAFFDPFVERRPEWTFIGGTATYNGDSIVIDSRPTNINAVVPIVPARDVFTVGGRIGAANTTGQRQLLLAAVQIPGYYYCELYDDNTMAFNIVYTLDNSSYTNIASVPATGPFANAPVTLSLRNDPPNIMCETSWPSSSPSVSAPIPGGIAPSQTGLLVNGVVVTLDYFIQIHSD